MTKKGYIFLCSDETEKECLDKMLMGSKKNYIKPGQVQKGENIFLYNYISGKLFGEFVAVTGSQENIDPDAWKEAGGFPMQVQVSWKHKYPPLSRVDVDPSILTFRGNLPNKILNQELLNNLEERFNKISRGIQPHIEYARENLPIILTEDHHLVRSGAEREIDNWLFTHIVCHGTERALPESAGHCDFYIPKGKGEGIYIEYWGMEGEDYLARKTHKLKIYKRYKLSLIELNPEDIKHLGDVLKSALLYRGVFVN